MSELLRTSSVSEAKAFLRAFIQDIAVNRNTAVIQYTIPTPHDSSPAGADTAGLRLAETVRYMVRDGGPSWTRTRDLSLIRTAL